MSVHDSKPGAFGRIWRSLVAVSDAAVAVHYRAPWRADAGTAQGGTPEPHRRAAVGAPEAGSDAHAEVLRLHEVLEPVL